MNAKRIDADLLYLKITTGQSCRQLANRVGLSKSTVGNRTHGYNNPSSLANAVARDYITPFIAAESGKRVRLPKLSQRQRRLVEFWLRENILELCQTEGFSSIGQTNYRTKAETGKTELTEWVDWYLLETHPDEPTDALYDGLTLNMFIAWLDVVIDCLALLVLPDSLTLKTLMLTIDGLILDGYCLPYILQIVNTLDYWTLPTETLTGSNNE